MSGIRPVIFHPIVDDGRSVVIILPGKITGGSVHPRIARLGAAA